MIAAMGKTRRDLELSLSLADAVRGALGGAVGTVAMDAVTQLMYDHMSPDAAAREKAAMPGGKGAAEQAARKAARLVGAELDDHASTKAASAFHWGVGVLPAAVYYGLFAKRLAKLGPLRGLLFGLGPFVLVDEGANTVLGLASPPQAYPVESHLRGLVGHLTLGAVTEGVYSVLRAVT